MGGADFGHHGTLCTLETMVLRFGLADPAFQAMGEIVHEIDLRNGAYVRPETSGIDAMVARKAYRSGTGKPWRGPLSRAVCELISPSTNWRLIRWRRTLLTA